MTDNQFDNFIRARLKDHSAPVPPGLWEKINPEKKDDRKGFILPRINRFGGYMVIAALLVALGVGGYLYYSSDSKSELSAVPGNKPPVTPGGAGAVTVTAHKPGATNNSVNSNNTNTDANNTNLNVNTSKSSTGSSIINAKQLPVSGYHSGNSNALVAQLHNTGDQPAATAVSNDNAMAELSSYNGNFNLLSASTIPFTKDEQLFGLKDLKEIELANAMAHTRRVPNIVICPSARGDGSSINPDWYGEVYVSPDLAFKSVQNISATPQYMQRKDSSERMQVGFSAGFRIVKPLSDNLLLKAGLQYTQANEKFVYRAENEIKTTTVVTQRQIIRGPGDTVLVSDTSVLQQIGYRNNTVHNHYRTIDVPITLGYQFGRDDNDFRVGVNAGVVINLSSWYQGVILDPTLTAVPIDKNSNNMIYKSNIGLGLYGSLSFMKRLNDDTHLFFEPYFRYNLSNMTNAQASYNQKFSIGGLAIGLRYNLNRR